MNIQDAIEFTLTTVEGYVGGQTFTWQGQVFPCVPGKVQSDPLLSMGGLSDKSETVLVVRKSSFTGHVYPIAQQYVTFRGTQYCIRELHDNSTDQFYRLVLKHPQGN